MNETEIRAKYTMRLKNKDYLMVAGRILLFRLANPTGTIDTELLQSDANGALFRARIINNDGQVLAAGHAYAILADAKNYGNRVYEKAETAAIGRALAHAGFGTDAAGDDIEDEMEHLADAPVPPNGKEPVPPPPVHWSAEPANIAALVYKYEKKYDLKNLMDMEAMVGKTAKDFETGKAFGTALDKAMAEATKNEPPAEPRRWWDDPTKLDKLKMFLAPFQMPLGTALVALKLDNWWGFTSVDQAMQAIRALAINEAWPILADKARYLKTALGNTNIIFDTPLGGLLLYSREKFSNTMIEQSVGLKDEWEKVKTWEILPDMGYHDLPEQIRLVTKFVEEKDSKAAHLEISEIECVAQVAF